MVECDCKPGSTCTSSSICETNEDIATCVTSTWSWVSRLVNTVLGLRTLFKWLHQMWKVLVGSLSNINKCVEIMSKLIQNLYDQPYKRRHFQNPAPMTPYPSDSELRVILVGACMTDLSMLQDTLLGRDDFYRGRTAGLHRQCVRWRTVIEGHEMIVVATPDILGSSLGPEVTAQEALRSLLLASPGPHAFLLVMQTSQLCDGGDGMTALQALLDLMGEGALSHVLLLLIHTEPSGGSSTPRSLLEGVHGGLLPVLSLCGQRVEVLDLGTSCPAAQRRAQAQRLVERVVEMSWFRGYYLHELQEKEDRMREELLLDAAAELRRRLGDKKRGDGEGMKNEGHK
ncbi:hypothetical protein JZ751_015323 [Albula glossodonta]|uniref:AIG1-type G domain-containing protein n=1 Tax=Albula glossodonta TaxID=121402 RepID=A0A8T2NSH5_9TELE|nr:hypothetical protein JZ751_015323 [Albula glossodonta]